MWQEGRSPGREGRSRRETGSRHRQGFPGSLSLPCTPSVLSKALSFSETPLLLWGSIATGSRDSQRVASRQGHAA